MKISDHMTCQIAWGSEMHSQGCKAGNSQSWCCKWNYGSCLLVSRASVTEGDHSRSVWTDAHAERIHHLSCAGKFVGYRDVCHPKAHKPIWRSTLQKGPCLHLATPDTHWNWRTNQYRLTINNGALLLFIITKRNKDILGTQTWCC